MGSYAELTIGSRSYYSMKNQVDLNLLTVFRERDRLVQEISAQEYYHDSALAPDKTVSVYKYSASRSTIVMRLEIMGYTLQSTEVAFEAAMEEVRSGECSDADFYLVADAQRSAFIDSFTLSKWIQVWKRIVSENITYTNHRDGTPEDIKTEVSFVLQLGHDFYEGFPPIDPRYYLRALAEVIDTEQVFSIDYTDLVDGGYYSPDDKLTLHPSEWYQNEFKVGSPIIILTEGSTDSNLLRATLELLYPQVFDFYTFLDFGVSNLQGSASALVGIVKAFIGADVQNRLIALFDNDTAAEVALKGLAKVNIPAHFKVLKYPDLSLATKYPTVGPQGTVSMDVNGLAASLELYFGTDILKLNTPDVSRIQWKGYDQSLGRYQGEVLDKTRLQEAYRQKLSDCRANNALIPTLDWTGMDSIFRMIFAAFHK